MSTKGAVSSVSRLLQDMQHRSKHRSIVWALRKHFSLIFIGPSQYLIAKTAVLELLFYQFELFPLFGGFAFRWLYVVSGCLVCKLEYVSSNDTLDLKSKDRPQYIPIWLWRYYVSTVYIPTWYVYVCLWMYLCHYTEACCLLLRLDSAMVVKWKRHALKACRALFLGQPKRINRLEIDSDMLMSFLCFMKFMIMKPYEHW